MKKSLVFYVSLLSILSMLLVSLIACTSSKVEYTAPVFESRSDALQTFQMRAVKGASSYSSTCASCHGTNGQGNGRWPTPALWGPDATLGTYEDINFFNDASEMLNVFLPALMPLSAKGSLSHDEYVDVLCYILVQDNQVSPSTLYDESRLGSIKIK